MGIFKSEVEKAQLEIEKNKAIVDKYTAEQTAVAREKQRKDNVRQKEKKSFDRNCQNYGWNQPIMNRFFLLLSWLNQHPDRTVVYVNEHGAQQHKTVSLDELIKSFRLESLILALQELSKDTPQTEPKYSE